MFNNNFFNIILIFKIIDFALLFTNFYTKSNFINSLFLFNFNLIAFTHYIIFIYIFRYY